MDQSQQDGFYVDMELPYEAMNYRPFANGSNLDYRYLGNTDAGSRDAEVSPGGFLQVRPKIKFFGGSTAILPNTYCERSWFYETLPTTAGTVYRYWLYSVKDTNTSLYSMYYLAVGGTGAITQFTAIRDVNSSVAPHFVVVYKGKAYVKAFPNSLSAEKLGTMIFDGSTGTPTYRPWGILGPTSALQMSGWTGFLTADYSATATSMVVTAITAPPATPFVMQVGLTEASAELVNVTAKAGAGPYTLTVTRGYSGSTASAHKNKDRVIYRGWTASDHKVVVKTSWQYTYCYKSITGQYSNTVAAEQNPDNNQSQTYSFADLIPKMTVTGHADTTNIPSIVIFRSTDAGGTFYELETIVNTGAGSITYEDKSYASGSAGTTHNDPVPDTKIQTASVAPTLVSNSPPPTVNEPEVVGVDPPTLAFSSMTVFQSRIWMQVAGRLYASGAEETTVGNPEESFRLGRFGTYWDTGANGVALESTTQALYALTSGPTFMMTGSNLESFNLQKIGDATPMNTFDLGCSVSFLDRVAFVARGNRACVISGTTIDVISECILGIENKGMPRQVTFLSDASRQWIVFLSPGSTAANSSRMLVYDWKRSVEQRRDWWLPPWNTTLSTVFAAPWPGTYTFRSTSYGDTYLAGAVRQHSGSNASVACYLLTDNTGFDQVIVAGASSTEPVIWGAVVGPLKNPVGNHVNLHALPQLTTILTNVKVDYTAALNLSAYNVGISIFPDTSDLSFLGASSNDFTATATPATRRGDGDHTLHAGDYYTRIAQANIPTNDFYVYLHSGTIPYPSDTTIKVMRMAIATAPEAGEGM